MSNLDELLKLKELLDLGIITENDFKRKKSELFSDISTENKNSDFIKKEEIIIGGNEKVCPSCKCIIDKESEICNLCDYDFINKKISEKIDKPIENNNFKKYITIFFVIIIFGFLGTWFFLKNNLSSNSLPSDPIATDVAIPVSKPITSVDTSSTTSEGADATAPAAEQFTDDISNVENSQNPESYNQNNMEESDYSNINESYFYGNWEDENSTVSFNTNGTCNLIINNYTVNYFWKFENNYLYIGSNKSSLTKHDIYDISKNSFSYKSENENNVYHATRVD